MTMAFFKLILGLRMRITIQAIVDREDGSCPVGVSVGALTRNADHDPASGLGLFVGESHDILQKIQGSLLQEQARALL